MKALAIALLLGSSRLSGVASGQNPETPARAQCDTTRTSVVPPGVGHPYVNSITVRTNAVSSLPIVGARLGALRRTSETGVIARQLLITPGQPFDSARAQESLRRLRQRGLYREVAMTIVACTNSDAIDVTFETRDAWTLRPVARVVPPSTVVLGIEDANFMGTGRSISVAWDQTSRGQGGSIGLTDPWLLGTQRGRSETALRLTYQF